MVEVGEKIVWERERRKKDREDVHIWSCSMALSLGGQLHTRPPLDLLEGGGGGSQEGSEDQLWRC